MYGFGCKLHFFAVALHAVGTFTGYLDCRILWWHLLDITEKLWQRVVDELACDMLGGVGHIDGMLFVVAGCGSTELQRGCIFLGVVLHALNLLGHFAGT